jgi:hypothetical protein
MLRGGDRTDNVTAVNELTAVTSGSHETCKAIGSTMAIPAW